jgi:hypothetical protein
MKLKGHKNLIAEGARLAGITVDKGALCWHSGEMMFFGQDRFTSATTNMPRGSYQSIANIERSGGGDSPEGHQ